MIPGGTLNPPLRRVADAPFTSKNMKRSFKQYMHTFKSSGAIGRAQYISSRNGPLLPIELLTINIYTHIFKT